MVETETSLKVKCLRSDNGGEYIDGGFSEYCAAQRIRMEKTILGTPQQNGVTERMNRTLNERARIPMEFRLPEEVWSGKEVKFSRLKVFGCVSYVHIDSDARSKLDAKSKICFFIGYGDEKFGCRFWDEQNRKIIRSRNVIFNQQVDLSTPVVEVRKSSRNIRPPHRYSSVLNYLLLTDGGEPECYDEALQDENSSKWELAMKDEMDSLLGNQTWELTELPVGKKALHKNLHLEQLDVKTTFLHGSDIEKINNLKKQLSKQFLEYVKKVLNRFNMNEAKPVSTPLGSHFKLSKEQSLKTEEEKDHMSKVPYASTIGSLMYAMVCTRPDIAHAVGVVSKFMSRPGKQHWEAVKWILRYLKGSLDTCLCFTGASLKLQGYVDADFASDIDSRKSTIGFVFTLCGTTISWTSNLQKIVTLSTIEAEYVAATEAEKEMIWLHGFLDELGKKQGMDILHSDS
ncbi:Retrovirus-related Pol polyprotein from transposon TNT 1-94 [Vitis vinifera]|uniref:Retrovirus-related Pol polyprotein from transposon TNT 1-94 n=1 Tax=Vitis vinifera TaxID=29760 RepID=A0A438K0A7_VITVI|nr:Retrovirus-related Pol polyprotein from transposon TNT 1-94 [Vitis vinifera]